jgi:uncharacterized membrane protein
MSSKHNGGAKPGAGRKRGSPNKLTQAAILKAQAEGIMPLEVILAQMRKYHAKAEDLAKAKNPDEKKVLEAEGLALSAAKEAAPYLHNKLSAVTRRDEPFDLTKLSEEELKVVLAIKKRLAAQPGDDQHRVH